MKLQLSTIDAFLKESGFETYLEHSSKEIPFEQIFVEIGTDEKMRDLTLQIRLYDQALPEGTHRKELAHPRFLDFFSIFPFEIEQTTISDFARLVSLVNKVILLPGFIFSETDDFLYYRYIYPSLSEEIFPSNIDMILSTIIYQMETFTTPFEEVARGIKTYEKILSEADQYI